MSRRSRIAACAVLIAAHGISTWIVVDHLRPIWVELLGAVMCIGGGLLFGAFLGRWAARGAE